MTALQLIDETVAVYPKGKGRAIDTSGFCHYMSARGNRCAVGRCVRDQVLKTYRLQGAVTALAMYDIKTGRMEEVEDIDPLLKPRYRGFPIDLWFQLQKYHDEILVRPAAEQQAFLKGMRAKFKLISNDYSQKADPKNRSRSHQVSR